MVGHKEYLELGMYVWEREEKENLNE